MKSFIPRDQRSRIISNIVIIAAGLLMLGCVLYFGEIMGFLKTLLGVLAPFLVGIAVAFLLSPMLRVLERFFSFALFRKKAHPKLNRILSLVVCYAALLSFLFAFAKILIPQLIVSIQSILNFITTLLSANSDKIAGLLEHFEILEFRNEELIIAWENLYSQFTRFLDYSSFLFNNVLSFSKSIYTVVFQCFVGLVASIYMLVDKERFAAQCKKACYAMLSPDSCNSLIFWFRRANRVFAGYISGKIIDSIIIGILCYLGMLIFRLEYSILISVIVGVTNVIPFFGPFIGAIPSILILLMVNPISALWFALFILVLQQIDGNVIGPFILGDSVGISPFWIMVSIVVGSGLFGFMGMLLSVPVFALLYAIARAFFETRLARKKLPVSSAEYYDAPEKFADEKPGTKE